MDLKSFISPMPPEIREEFARKCQTTRGHLQNVMYGKSCATDLAVNIERESNGVVTRQELRDDWANHWPELNKPEPPLAIVRSEEERREIEERREDERRAEEVAAAGKGA